MEGIIFFGILIIGNWLDGHKFKDMWDFNFEENMRAQKKTQSAATDKVSNIKQNI
ncbi:hypothetical protein [Companilactobacillus sp. DQM5]|uniref:hypothetical protein n=1 Tax=Companilactobacillus sp. DQM5 TaxID=3463359 RepID=UPI004058B916